MLNICIHIVWNYIRPTFTTYTLNATRTPAGVNVSITLFCLLIAGLPPWSAAPSWPTAITLASWASSTRAWTSTEGRTSNWASGFVCHTVSSCSLRPLYPSSFKWSGGHRSVAPLINEAPLRVRQEQASACSSQQGNGDKWVTYSGKGFCCTFWRVSCCSAVLLRCRLVFLKCEGKNITTFYESLCVYLVLLDSA